jgi:hypothetical protein
MSEARDELRRALREAAAAGQGTHPEPEELAAYPAGELSAAAERRLEDHLVACPACAALLLDLDGLADPEFGAGRPGATEGDAERDAAWESFRAQIATTAPEPAPAPVVRGRFAPPPAPRWLYALAATLLLAVGALSLEVTSLSRTVAELSRPEVNAPVVDLSQGTARGGEAARTAAVPAGARLFTLVLSPAAHPPHTAYGVEIADAAGRAVVEERRLQPNPYGSFSLALSRRTLGTGDYRVRLFAIDGSLKVPIEEYALRVLP